MFKADLLLWLIPKNNSIRFITSKEEKSASKLNIKRKLEFLESRSSIRQVLSNLLNIEPLKVPLNANYGAIPNIPSELGFISLSHCDKAILIGWSRFKLGVDIEKNKRNINADKLMKRYYFPKEIRKIQQIENYSNLKSNVLSYWVLKEAVIKLKQGSIAKDLLNWEIDIDRELAFNSKMKINSYIKKILYGEWVIGVASDNINLKQTNIMICDMN